MHYVGYAEMAAAVSNAGGLGVITALTIAQPPRGVEVSQKNSNRSHLPGWLSGTPNSFEARATLLIRSFEQYGGEPI